jgi:hypothetical protein
MWQKWYNTKTARSPNDKAFRKAAGLLASYDKNTLDYYVDWKWMGIYCTEDPPGRIRPWTKEEKKSYIDFQHHENQWVEVDVAK